MDGISRKVPLGNEGSRVLNANVNAPAEREQLEWLSAISPAHESQLRRVRLAEGAAKAEREQLQWLAEISTEHESQLRRLVSKESDVTEVRLPSLVDGLHLHEADWDPAKHPRLGSAPNAGWFAATGGSDATGSGKRTAASASSAAGAQSKAVASQVTSDPSRWYLPAEDKGTWLGAKGESTFRLKTPVTANDKLVQEIHFTKGLPILWRI